MAGNVEKGLDLDIIEGSTDIFLIAPHGVETRPRDDINTVELAQQDNPKIKMKLAYKELLGIQLPAAPGMDI